MTENDDLITILILTIITIFAVILDINILRHVIGIIFILFCPGYALIAALFTKRKDIDAIERIALSFGLSIAVVPLIGLGLNYTPWGIRLTPILVANTTFTFGMIIIAFMRRSQIEIADRFSFSYSVPDYDLGESRTDKALSVILIISIVLAIGALVYVVQAPKQGETFTEFYILGPGGMADDYPTSYELGDSKPVIMGIVNHEHVGVAYEVQILLEENVLWSKSYEINDEETMEATIEIAPNKIGENMKLQFLLFKDGEQYRDLHLWITVV